MRRVTSGSHMRRLLLCLWGVSTVAALPSAGCTGRSDVTTGSDQAQNLPPRPQDTPQQYPTPSQLPSAHEPAPATQRQREHDKGVPTTRSATAPPDPAAAQVGAGKVSSPPTGRSAVK